MRLNVFLVLALLCLFEACSFKSGDGAGGGSGGSVATTSEIKIDPNGDSDGDGTKDGDELNRGSSPFVADIPELKVRFLQNYKIEVFYHPKNGDAVKDQKTFIIDTNVKDTNPEFKFRVGNVFARAGCTINGAYNCDVIACAIPAITSVVSHKMS